MLVNPKLLRGDPDDDGVAIVAVMIVMFVGFIAAAIIAAAVMFTIQTNSSNKSGTQAFIAAESGRDQMLSAYLGSCKLSIPASTTTPPLYNNVTVVSSGTDATHQTKPATCASTTATTVFVIASTGVGPDGTTSTITSTYTRPVTYTNQPGGQTSALYGTFQNTKLSYTGDFVVRGGDYQCTSGGQIVGNLWILKDPSSGVGGNAYLSTSCGVTGSIYAQGAVQFQGSGITVGGNVIAAGSTGNVTKGASASGTTITGGVYADGSVDLTPVSSTSIFLAGGTVTAGSAANVTNYSASSGGCAPTPNAKCVVNGSTTATPGTAMYIPAPSTVWSMTTWVDLDNTSNWDSNPATIKWHNPTTTAACWGDWGYVLNESLGSGNTRVGVDLTNCPIPSKGQNAGQLPITITPPALQTNDVLFILPAATPMSVSVTGALNPTLSTSPPANWPQLYFVHSDSKLGNNAPDCGSGLANDQFTLTNPANSRVMVYTPCGLNSSSLNGNGKYQMTGQFYSNAADGKNTAQPAVDCQPMTWSPILNLGCEIAPSGGGGGGGSGTPVPQPPALLSQTEQ